MARLILASGVPERLESWTQAFSQPEHALIVIEPIGISVSLAMTRADAALIDTSSPGDPGLSNIAAWSARHIGTRLIVACQAPDDGANIALLKAGASALCQVDAEPAILRRMLEAVMRDELWVPHAITAWLLKEVRDFSNGPPPSRAHPALTQLTLREHEIARLVARGASNKHIARLLNITERTVKFHITQIYRRAGINDRVRLALLIGEAERFHVARSD